ncbi:class I SAM-dependent methyltransferase [Microcoleus sp. FACHB-68]|uniref:class I SAM-dependent methyltransferase n=1 Tax=Microcoleus sp. FACHB-68 TaxID=2692826 RepID=UPI001683373F|nr:class I SAM-dependent methyltransferase [Microcoleus sp. FACHB-68]MBD1938080.1 class I SAM-dependent methyltransferase [Microcoleus sp. FACHB-68]
MQRVLEAEVMDTWEEAIEYDAMDFTGVNTAFAQNAVEIGPPAGLILDAGTGTARIPILISQMRPHWQIIGIDLSKNMLQVGSENVEKAGLQSHIQLELVDAKKLPYLDHHFDMVISNSIVHHLPDPLPFFREIKRVLKPAGAIFLRDLFRPADEKIMDTLVNRYATDCNAHQKKLFRDSLNAAFTLEEVNQIVKDAGFKDVKVYSSSNRHWTAERTVQK